MKNRKIYKLLLVAIGVLAITLIGCGAEKDVKEEPAARVSDERPTPPSDVEEVLKDTEEIPEEEIPQTDPEDIQGEGMVDDTVPDIEGIEKKQVAEEIMLKNEAEADVCLFTVESIASSDMEIENTGEVEGKKVVVVNYSFENVSGEGRVYIDDMSFKLLANDAVCTPYFSPELSPAEPAVEGESSTGEVAFLVDSDCKDVVLVFDDEAIGTQAVFEETIE